MLTGQSTNQLELKINKAKFSSLVPAYWEIGLSISSPSFYGYSIEKNIILRLVSMLGVRVIIRHLHSLQLCKVL